MSKLDTFPADLVPPKPEVDISVQQIEYVQERELGHTATGLLWVPGDLDIEYFNRLRTRSRRANG